MKFLLLSLLLSLSLLLLSLSSLHDEKLDSDDGLDMIEIVKKRGYSIEQHFVTTNDNYILSLFHITKEENPNLPLGSPVLLQHGLFDSSYTWVNNYQNESLAYILLENGYDVWCGNNRGNTYSRNHTIYNPNISKEFWQFTFNEMAEYDDDAMINFILKYTKYEKLSYVGHSEGTMQMFSAASLQLPFTKKVNLFIALAPVSFIKHIKSPEVILLAKTNLPQELMDKGFFEIFGNPKGNHLGESLLCSKAEKFCDVALMTFLGPSLNVNVTRLQVYLSETPAGTSIMNLDHFRQLVINGKYCKYDYGPEKNMEKYGSTIPPDYDLSKITVPTALFSGSRDWLGDPKDLENLKSVLPKETIVFENNEEDMAHCDFVWGIGSSIQDSTYKKALMLLSQYNTDNKPIN